MGMASTTDDVLAALARAWGAVGLAGVTTGGLHAPFVPGSVQPAFAWATATATKRQNMSGPAYLETFLVVARVYSVNGSDGQRVVERGLKALDWSQRLWRTTSCKVVEVRPADVPQKPPNAPTVARDVVESAAAWDVVVQQQR
jgi:hypothetical protein